jgi:hypothetical protein
MLLLSVLLLSCSDSDTDNDNGTDNESFKITVNLTDGTGNPLPGYKLGFAPANWQELLEDSRRSNCTLSFALVGNYQVKVEVLDYFGNHIRTMLSDSLVAGTHSAVWDGNDDDGNRVAQDGIYQFRVEYSTNGQCVFSDVAYSYLLADLNPHITPYNTDENGHFESGNPLSFPALYCGQQVAKTDYNGSISDSIDFDTHFIVYASKIDSTGTESRFSTFTVTDGLNTLNLNWEQMQPFAYRIMSTSSPATTNDRGVGDDIVPEENGIVVVYPCPFN